MTTHTDIIAKVKAFKELNPLGETRTIQYEGKEVTGKISTYRLMFGQMLYGIYEEKQGITYYSMI